MDKAYGASVALASAYLCPLGYCRVGVGSCHPMRCAGQILRWVVVRCGTLRREAHAPSVRLGGHDGVTASGQHLRIKEKKGKHMALLSAPTPLVPVTAAAPMLGVTPRTVRRWLAAGLLAGQKVGTSWGVCLPAQAMTPPSVPAASQRALHRRLRQVGARLITVGNQAAAVVPTRGAVFLAWRTPHGLQVTLAIGRRRPVQGWAPYTLGTVLPFWIRERSRWSRVLPLLRWYDRLRGWCHPRLLRVRGVREVILAEIVRLEAALNLLQEHTGVSYPLADPACGAGASPDGMDGGESGGREEP